MEQNGNTDEKKYGKKNNYHAHGRCTSLVFVKFRKLGRLTNKSLLSYGFPELIFPEEFDKRGDKYHGCYECNHDAEYEKGKIAHVCALM
jgi:hypothetical protein